MLLENEFPRTDVAQMFLIVPNRHVDHVSELTKRDWTSCGRLFQFCIQNLECVGGGLLIRFGDPRDHVGTIPHFHANVVRPIREGGCSLPLAKKVGGEYGHVEDYARLRRFINEINERGGNVWLFSPRGIQETQPSLAR